jgi:hypothetical protein
MKNSRKDLKEFLLKILKEIKSENAEPLVEPDKKIKPETKPETPPSPQRRRKLVPDKWPEEAPGPKPKAEGEEIVSIKETLEKIKKVKELSRMKTLISENTKIQNEMSMDIEDPYYETPHPSVVKGIEGEKKTPFNDLNFFQGGIIDYSTLEKLGSEEFNKIIRDIKQKGKPSEKELARMLITALSIEQKHIKSLEILAIKKVKQQFGLPDEITDKLKVKLTQNVDLNDDDDSDNIEQDVVQNLEFTEEEKQIIKTHVEKRVIQNALMMGAGFRAHSVFNTIKNDLDAIDSKLFPLYEMIMPNVALFMWQNPIEDFMDSKGLFVDGISKIKKDKDGNIRAEAQSTFFPILLHETAKAAIELLFANYLISLTEKYGANVAGEIIKQSDVFEEEIWHKRIGPTLWKYLHDVIDYVIVHEKQSNYNLVSYLLSDISMMEPKEFIKFMNTIVYNGEKSISIISKMIDDIEQDLASEEVMSAETDEESLQRTAQEVAGELAQLAKGAQNKQAEITPVSFEEMNLEQLQVELKNAIDEERYEDAAKISKIIRKNSS